MVCVIIDSGIKKEIIAKNIIEKKAIFEKDNQIVIGEDAEDYYGHGTACYSIINKYYQYASFVILKIADYGISTISKLKAALEYCYGIECNVINISMAVIGEGCHELDEIIERLVFEHNVKIVASYPNGEKDGYPANSPYVWGIDGEVVGATDWVVKRRKKRAKDLTLNIVPEVTERENRNYYFFGGNSKATAIASALMMQQIEAKVIEDKLFKSNKNRGLKLEQYIEKNKEKGFYNNESLKQLLEIEDNNENDVLINKGTASPNELLHIVERLEDRYNITIDDENIAFSDFLTLNNLNKLVRRNGGCV